MPKKLWVLSLLTIALVTFFATLNLSAQNLVTGEWTASLNKDKSKLSLELVRSGKKGRIDQSFELSELGLTREQIEAGGDRKSTRLNSSHLVISYAVFCLKNKTEVVN